MIEPWQVWSADSGHYVVIVGSVHHLRLTSGRVATVLPISSTDLGLRHQVPIDAPDGQPAYVVTEQFRTMSTGRFVRSKPEWTLSAEESEQVRRALKHMVDF